MLKGQARAFLRRFGRHANLAGKIIGRNVETVVGVCHYVFRFGLVVLKAGTRVLQETETSCYVLVFTFFA